MGAAAIPGISSPPNEPTNTDATALINALADGSYDGTAHPVVSITYVGDIKEAAQSINAPWSGHAANTVYVIEDGDHDGGSSYFLHMLKGGPSNTNRRYFIGRHRHAVRMHGRCIVEPGINNVTVQNMFFEVDRAIGGNEYSTICSWGENISFRDLTMIANLTGPDGVSNGARNGGAIEIVYGPTNQGSKNVLIDNCSIDHFGRYYTTGSARNSTGHQDHGIYASGCDGLTISNCIIRNNSSRGIQLFIHALDLSYTSVLRNVLIEGNYIYGNGFANFEDGIVINRYDAIEGPITIRRNFFWNNYWAGIRFVSADSSGISVVNNTFYGNGVRASQGTESELNMDADGSGADTDVRKNIFYCVKQFCNNDSGETDHAYARGFIIDNNVIYGPGGLGAGPPAHITNRVNTDPQFTNAGASPPDLHNAAVTDYGVYGS